MIPTDSAHELTEEDEKRITLMMAETFRFTPNEKQTTFTCNFCGQRFHIWAIGLPINERMIQHYERKHKRDTN
jgi:hypothetical protein